MSNRVIDSASLRTWEVFQYRQTEILRTRLNPSNANLLGALVVAVHDQLTAVLEQEDTITPHASVALTAASFHCGWRVDCRGAPLRLSHSACVRRGNKLAQAYGVELRGKGEAQPHSTNAGRRRARMIMA
jgi:hypothetical protein